jgi:hypothetical protein
MGFSMKASWAERIENIRLWINTKAFKETLIYQKM